ncbi:lytic transglycosylase [Psychromarinibacter halotolerans]|uniref:Lytic transglycosylase n=1 Tax=Psychromarinibacter halotolerans TaxID=1775175 RepID=A0ABV7GLF4_9RHOB|nr:lytic transglycosylase [Psychromarinibacter halotolerans]MDF0597709.1 lytic transglycosylase [Psychromarinibacter halotolerans]
MTTTVPGAICAGTTRAPLIRRALPLAVLLPLLALAGCGGGGDGMGDAPRNPENACAVITERPHYYEALRASERKWGVPVHVQMAILFQESTFRSDARPPRKKGSRDRISSAYGYAQVLDGTWGDYLKGPARNGAQRNNFNDATDFMGWYISESNRALGIPLNDAKNSYLAYHEGRAGFQRGNHLKKTWLLRVSDGVASRADRYFEHLLFCGL